jgi:excisionase family DNA binding protein
MRLIDAKQASKLLGVRLPRLYELTRLKRIPFVRLGERQIRFDPEILQAWVMREANLNSALISHEQNQR